MGTVWWCGRVWRLTWGVRAGVPIPADGSGARRRAPTRPRAEGRYNPWPPIRFALSATFRSHRRRSGVPPRKTPILLHADLTQINEFLRQHCVKCLEGVSGDAFFGEVQKCADIQSVLNCVLDRSL